jgi:hypothetical protein
VFEAHSPDWVRGNNLKLPQSGCGLASLS